MRLRLLLGAAVGVAALATPASAVVPGTDCHGVAFTDPAGDQYLVVNTNTLVRPTVAIDVRDVWFTGSGIDEKVAIQVTELKSWNNTQYTFRWDDPDTANLGGYYELRADYLGANTVDRDGDAYLTRNDINGSSIWLSGHATTHAYHGAVVNPATGQEAPGVIEIGLDPNMGVTFPGTIRGMQADAYQLESNVLTDVTLRRDSAPGPTSWAQPC
jgi:hypothetical protein